MGRQSLKDKSDRSADSPKKMIAQREGAVEQMNSALRRKFNKIERSVNDLRAENIRYYHKIGKICEEIRSDPDRYVGNDGTSGLKLIEQALSTQARTLRSTARFAELYGDEEVEELITMYHTATNFQLHFGHVRYLLTLSTAAQRRKYAIEAVEKMLDPAALHTLIKKRQQRGEGHGRPHAVPKTVAAQIRQVLAISQQWQRKNESVWNGDGEEDNNVFTNVLNTPPDELDQEMLDNLRQIKVLMGQISESATENTGLTGRVIEHVQGVLTTREAEEESQETQGRSQRAIDLDGGQDGATPHSRRRRRGAAT
jgi:hypothetical protein